MTTKVTLFYNGALRGITGKDSEEMVVSDGMNFPLFLHFIFSSYPDIFKKHKPGELGFLLNGGRPSEHDILMDGDELILTSEKLLEYHA